MLTGNDILWSIWKHRKVRVWQDVNEVSAHVVDRTIWLLEEWSTTNTTTSRCCYGSHMLMSSAIVEDSNSTVAATLGRV